MCCVAVVKGCHLLHLPSARFNHGYISEINSNQTARTWTRASNLILIFGNWYASLRPFLFYTCLRSKLVPRARSKGGNTSIRPKFQILTAPLATHYSRQKCLDCRIFCNSNTSIRPERQILRTLWATHCSLFKNV